MKTAHAKILIAEDERPLAKAVEVKLQSAGYTTKIARNGQECLDLLAHEPFDILLLDMLMPVMSGMEVLAQLQKTTTGHKPIIFALSNLSMSDDEEHVLAMGVTKYFIKSNTPLSVIVSELQKLKIGH